MVSKGHRPQRTCLGCGRRDDQSKLVRVVMNSEGELRIQPFDGGRGGYLHLRPDCWQGFLKRRSHYRAFRAEIGKHAKEKLVNELSATRGVRDGKNTSPSAG